MILDSGLLFGVTIQYTLYSFWKVIRNSQIKNRLTHIVVENA